MRARWHGFTLSDISAFSPSWAEDKGYPGHNHAREFHVWIISQAASALRSAARCVAAPPVEPVIGHIKAERRMGRNYLKGRHGDRINDVLAAAGYNFSPLLRWLTRLLRALILAVLQPGGASQSPNEKLLDGSSQTSPDTTRP